MTQPQDTAAPLKECPFCGCKAVIRNEDVEPQGDSWYGSKVERFVFCGGCGASLFDKYFHDGFIDDASAIEAWNRRAPSEQVASGPSEPVSLPDAEFIRELVEGLSECEEIFVKYEINRIDGEDISDKALSMIRALLAKYAPSQERDV